MDDSRHRLPHKKRQRCDDNSKSDARETVPTYSLEGEIRFSRTHLPREPGENNDIAVPRSFLSDLEPKNIAKQRKRVDSLGTTEARLSAWNGAVHGTRRDQDNLFASYRLSSDEDDMMALARKRRAEISDLKNTTKRRSKPDTSHGALGAPSLLFSNEAQATAKLVASHMIMHVPEQAKSTSCHEFSTPSHSLYSAGGKPSTLTARPPERKTRTAATFAPRNTPAPLPRILAPPGTPRFVIATTLPRRLISEFQSRVPAVDFVDRDFTSHNTWNSSINSLNCNELASPQVFEADMIPSPSTGIILTTLLKVRQKPLPGSNMLTHIRRRVAAVAPMYECLKVLVSGDNPQSESVEPLSDNDCESYADFVAFTLAIEDVDIRVMYIGGGSKTLASWTVAITFQLLPPSNVQNTLLERETGGETFLRRAGLNAYASQVLLANLERMHGDAALSQFLKMSARQKVYAFHEILGGKRALQKVANRFSQPWR